jgi:hypothetical protein
VKALSSSPSTAKKTKQQKKGVYRMSFTSIVVYELFLVWLLLGLGGAGCWFVWFQYFDFHRDFATDGKKDLLTSCWESCSRYHRISKEKGVFPLFWKDVLTSKKTLFCFIFDSGTLMNSRFCVAIVLKATLTKAKQH